MDWGFDPACKPVLGEASETPQALAGPGYADPSHSASGSCSLVNFPPHLGMTMLSRAMDAAGKIRALFYPGERGVNWGG